MVGEEAELPAAEPRPVEGVPTAELLHVDDEFLFMTHLPGGAAFHMLRRHERQSEPSPVPRSPGCTA